MKKLLGLLTFFAMVNIAGAAVLKVVPVDIAQSEGRLGGPQDPLEESDTIGLAIVLENNPFWLNEVAYPAYDGYYLSSMDIDLEVTGPGSLSVVQGGLGDDLGVHPDLIGFSWSGIAGNAIAELTGFALTPIGPGETDIIWNLLLHCDGVGDPVVIDLTLGGLSEYAEYEKTGTGGSWVWAAMAEGDLGDLTIYQVPEPMTVALLSLGGLFLLRRRK